jgi:hypothetical protein
MSTEKVTRYRMFTFMQYLKHPETGEELYSEDKVIKALEKKSIKEWAYAIHDKDPRSSQEFEAYCNKHGEPPTWNVGDPKPVHIQGVIKVSPAQTVETIAKWFDLPPQFIEIKSGRNTFLDCVQYLTHETEKQQALGKHHYDDSEIKANFDFRKQLVEREEMRLRYGQELSERDRLRYEVLYKGMTIRQVIEQNPVAYQNDFAYLDKMRAKYISETAPMPSMRINYYIYAEDEKAGSGIGKGLLSRALARSMYPHLTEDDEIFFEVGSQGALFEGYDGQPVIIWNDRRGSQLLKELGGVGNVYNVFDTTPTSQKQNVKYSSTKLINEVNIVNSVQPFKDFIDGISGAEFGLTTEDQNQARRRFPVIIPMRFEDFDILINKGFMNDTKEFDQYVQYGTIRGNMQRIQIRGAGREDVIKTAEKKLLDPVVKKHNEFKNRRVAKEEVTVEDILEGTSFTAVTPKPQVYSFTDKCLNCGKVWNCISEDPNDNGVEKTSMFCDNCQDLGALPF